MQQSRIERLEHEVARLQILTTLAMAVLIATLLVFIYATQGQLNQIKELTTRLEQVEGANR
ncbi:hypothetical protein [Campylobacter phage CJLB-5]|jgi:hypothetical protein|nr:hypothetical protein [Campylobacter phage CJLB-5]DAD61006.1 MAG TPA: BM2 protein [Caudoviricetes sp.]DAE55458.1 MAG TPA: BM2 protein [Caudoviricetes sp.]